MESTSLFLTQNNYDDSGDYILKFNSSQLLSGYEICLIQSNVYKQWFNVSDALNNNKIKIIVPTSATWSGGTPTYTLNTETCKFPDGYYSIKELESYLKKWCDESPSTRKCNQSKYPFTFSIGLDGRLVAVINSSKFTSNLGTTHVARYAVADFNSSMASFLGTNLSYYGSGEHVSVNLATNPLIETLTYTNTSFPQTEPISTLVFTSNLTYNPIVNNPRGIIGASYIGSAEFGSSASMLDSSLVWLPIESAIYSEIRISTFSQSGEKLKYYDTNSVFQLSIRKKENISKK
jgi:hypothetical protein